MYLRFFGIFGSLEISGFICAKFIHV